MRVTAERWRELSRYIPEDQLRAAGYSIEGEEEKAGDGFYDYAASLFTGGTAQAEQPEPFFDYAARKVKQAGLGALADFGEASELFADLNPILRATGAADKVSGVLDPLQEDWRGQAASLARPEDKDFVDSIATRDIRQLVGNTLSASVSSFPTLAVGAANPIAGAVVGGAQMGGGIRGEALAGGSSRDAANLAAVAGAVPAAALEKVGLEGVFRPAASRLGAAARGFISEGLTEAGQGLIEQGAIGAATGKAPTIGELARAAANEAIGGGILGGTIGSAAFSREQQISEVAADEASRLIDTFFSRPKESKPHGDLPDAELELIDKAIAESDSILAEDPADDLDSQILGLESFLRENMPRDMLVLARPTPGSTRREQAAREWGSAVDGIMELVRRQPDVVREIATVGTADSPLWRGLLQGPRREDMAPGERPGGALVLNERFADPVTAIHELGHAWERSLSAEERRRLDDALRNYNDDSGRREDFTEALEAWATSGSSPGPELEGFFSSFRAWAGKRKGEDNPNQRLATADIRNWLARNLGLDGDPIADKPFRLDTATDPVAAAKAAPKGTRYAMGATELLRQDYEAELEGFYSNSAGGLKPDHLRINEDGRVVVAKDDPEAVAAFETWRQQGGAARLLAQKIAANGGQGDIAWLERYREFNADAGADLSGVAGITSAQAAHVNREIGPALRRSGKGKAGVQPIAKKLPGSKRKRHITDKITVDETITSAGPEAGVAAMRLLSAAARRKSKAVQKAFADAIRTAETDSNFGRLVQSAQFESSARPSTSKAASLLAFFLVSPHRMATISPRAHRAIAQAIEISVAATESDSTELGRGFRALRQVMSETYAQRGERAAETAREVVREGARLAVQASAEPEQKQIYVTGNWLQQKSARLLSYVSNRAIDRAADSLVLAHAGEDGGASTKHLLAAYVGHYRHQSRARDLQLAREMANYAEGSAEHLQQLYREIQIPIEQLGEDAVTDFNSYLMLRDANAWPATVAQHLESEAPAALLALERKVGPERWKLFLQQGEKFSATNLATLQRISKYEGFRGATAIQEALGRATWWIHRENTGIALDEEAAADAIFKSGLDIDLERAIGHHKDQGRAGDGRIKHRAGSINLTWPPFEATANYFARLEALAKKNHAEVETIRAIQAGKKDLVREVRNDPNTPPNWNDNGEGMVYRKVLLVDEKSGKQVVKAYLVEKDAAAASKSFSQLDAHQKADQRNLHDYYTQIRRLFTEFNPIYGLGSAAFRGILNNARNLWVAEKSLLSKVGEVTPLTNPAVWSMAHGYMKAWGDIISASHSEMVRSGRLKEAGALKRWALVLGNATAGGGILLEERHRAIELGASLGTGANWSSRITGDQESKFFRDTFGPGGALPDNWGAARAGTLAFFAGLSRIGERAEGISAMRHILEAKEKGLIEFRQDNDPAEIAHLMRYAGTPNPYAGGLSKQVLNNIWLFGNATIQGNRFGLERWMRDPWTQARWTLGSAALPAIIWAMAENGALDELLGYDDEPYKRMAEQIPSFYKWYYYTIPWGLDRETGEPVFLTLPKDPNSAAFSGAIFHAIRENNPVATRISQVAMNIAAGTLFSHDQLNPVVKMAIGGAMAALGNNPTDITTGKRVMPQDQWSAGGMERAAGLAEAGLDMMGVARLGKGILGSRWYEKAMGAGETGHPIFDSYVTPAQLPHMFGEELPLQFAADAIGGRNSPAMNAPLLGLPIRAFVRYGGEWAVRENLEGRIKEQEGDAARLRLGIKAHIDSFMTENPGAPLTYAVLDYRSKNPAATVEELQAYRRSWLEQRRRSRLDPRSRALSGISKANQARLLQEND